MQWEGPKLRIWLPMTSHVGDEPRIELNGQTRNTRGSNSWLGVREVRCHCMSRKYIYILNVPSLLIFFGLEREAGRAHQC